MSTTFDEALVAIDGAVQRTRDMEEELRRAQPATKADIDAVLASLADLKGIMAAAAAATAGSVDVADQLAEFRSRMPAIVVRAVAEARRNHVLR